VYWGQIRTSKGRTFWEI